MVTAGIIVMALMMGAMFFGGHGMKNKHSDHQQHASTEIAVSSSTAIAVSATPVDGEKDAQHAH